MNKKLFLLPVLVLLLAGCGKKTASSSSQPSSEQPSSEPSSGDTSSSSSEEETTNYGTVDAPITVAEALAICEDELEESGDWTKSELVVKGLVVNSPTNKETFSQQIKIADSVDGTQLLVYSMNHDAGKAPYKNDELTVKGWVTLYGSTIEFSNSADAGKDYPVEVALTRKESSITYTALDDTITFDATNPTKGTNAATFDFKVSGTEGKNLVVKVNGTEVEAAEGKYTGTVVGETVVTADYEVVFDSIEIKYAAGSGTKNMAVATNEAEKFGLDATKWNVEGIKNEANNNVGLNNGGTIRLYNCYAEGKVGQGNALKIESKQAGVVIKRVEVTLNASSPADLSKLTFKAGTTVVAGEAGVYTVADETFVTLQNTSTKTASDQMWIDSVVVYYA